MLSCPFTIVRAEIHDVKVDKGGKEGLHVVYRGDNESELTLNFLKCLQSSTSKLTNREWIGVSQVISEKQVSNPDSIIKNLAFCQR